MEIYQQLWPLEIPRRNTNIVFGLRVIEFGETPVDETKLMKGEMMNVLLGGQTYLAMFVVDHDIMRLHIPVHNAL